MAAHSSTLAWKIPWKEEPGRLQSMGSLRVGHDWTTSLWLFTFMHWRRKWQPTQMFLPGESQGWGSLVGCCLWGRTVEHDWSDLAAAAYMFQHYSLKSSHPRLLPQSPKVCSLHLCLFCCLAHRVIIAIFLNSIYEYYIMLDYGRTLQAMTPVKPFVIRGTV